MMRRNRRWRGLEEISRNGNNAKGGPGETQCHGL